MVERLLRKQKVAGSIPVVGFFHCSPKNIFPLPTNKYSVPGLNWGPLACEASVITTRPTEPGVSVNHFSNAIALFYNIAKPMADWPRDIGVKKNGTCED